MNDDISNDSDFASCLQRRSSTASFSPVVVHTSYVPIATAKCIEQINDLLIHLQSCSKDWLDLQVLQFHACQHDAYAAEEVE